MEQNISEFKTCFFKYNVFSETFTVVDDLPEGSATSPDRIKETIPANPDFIVRVLANHTRMIPNISTNKGNTDY